jgi:hypothetical protein
VRARGLPTLTMLPYSVPSESYTAGNGQVLVMDCPCRLAFWSRKSACIALGVPFWSARQNFMVLPVQYYFCEKHRYQSSTCFLIATLRCWSNYMLCMQEAESVGIMGRQVNGSNTTSSLNNQPSFTSHEMTLASFAACTGPL